MSDEISAAPTPWKVADRYVMRDARDIRAANGALVAVGVSSTDARHIVAAANEYEERAAENNRLRKEVGRLRSAVKLLDAAAGPYCAPELRTVLIAEARAAIGEDAPWKKEDPAQ